MDNTTGIDISLSSPIDIDGTKITILHMREPRVSDQLAIEESKASDSIKNILLFANLCQVTPEDIKTLSLKDFQKLQTAFVGFID